LIGYSFRRNSLLKHVTEGKIQVKEKRGRRCKQLLDDVKETRRYRKLKEETLDRFYEELVVEEAVDMSQDRLRGDDQLHRCLSSNTYDCS
jgi:hypothetical protein